MKKLITPLLLSLSVLSSTNTLAATNIALSEFLNEIRGSSFNMYIAKDHIVGLQPRYKKTKKAIVSGYKKEMRNMLILLRRLNINAQLRMPGIHNDLPEYRRYDLTTKKQLLKLVTTQTELWDKKLSDVIVKLETTPEPATADEPEEELDDDIGADLDFDGDMIETTEDTYSDNGQIVDPGQVANDIFIEIGDLYSPLFRGQNVSVYADGKRRQKTLSGGPILDFQDIFVPYNINGLPSPLPLHAVFGTAFLPDKEGAIHMMRMYIFVFTNDPETKKVRIAVKPVKKFRWDRNEYYISAATGSVLRAIFAQALGLKVEDL